MILKGWPWPFYISIWQSIGVEKAWVVVLGTKGLNGVARGQLQTLKHELVTEPYRLLFKYIVLPCIYFNNVSVNTRVDERMTLLQKDILICSFFCKHVLFNVYDR